MLTNEKLLKRQSCSSAESYMSKTSVPRIWERAAETKSLVSRDFHSTRSRSVGCLLLAQCLTCFDPVLFYASPALSLPRLATPPTPNLPKQSFLETKKAT